MNDFVTVIGAGLAGAEAAWQVARRGLKVKLYEMRPGKMTPAHHTAYFAELVCSNSLKGEALDNAAGLLKEEMRRLDSLIMRAAVATRVPAGGALAVDRDKFAAFVTGVLHDHPLVEVVQSEIVDLPPERPVVIATGPLTADRFAASLKELTGAEDLYFYDAAAPIVTLDSIDQTKVFRAARYDKGDADYLNCPMTEEEYNTFYQALVEASVHQLKTFEKKAFFEGCMPVEVLASRGRQTLLFGPLKPVGLNDPVSGKRHFAVVQLRQDNEEGTLYNLVGFQTNLKWDDQQRVFRLIPGLEQADFVRLGVMHRNTFINSPLLLAPTLELKRHPGIFMAGQITGVEGYVESAAAGLVAGINAWRAATGRELLVWPPATAHGALLHYITAADPRHFQPMNINFGIIPPLATKIRDRRERYRQLADQALATLAEFSQL